VLTGLVDGRNNLYMYDLESEEVTQLTNDRYSYVTLHGRPMDGI
jgi:Tol biopolymer transport system component